MPWIKVFSLAEATGFLKKEYEAALKRAGRIWGIVGIMSQNPRAMKKPRMSSVLSKRVKGATSRS